MPPDFLDPHKFPTYVVLSALLAAAIGAVVYNFSHDAVMAAGIAVILFLADVIGLRILLRKDDE